MRGCTCLLLLALVPMGSGLFWDVLSCPLCYLPRIEWGTPYYYQQPAPVETPVITQAVQPVQQVQYVYKQPIVKYLQPVKYVYLQNNAGYAAGNGNSGNSNPAQTPRPPYKLSQEYLAKRGYSGPRPGPSSSYPTGSFSSPDPSDNIQSAPYAHKLPSISGKGQKNRKINKTEKKKPSTTTESPEDELVEFEEEPGKMSSPVEDINKRKKTFHIHEDIGGKPFPSPKGKSSSIPIAEEEEDLDILTTDDHMKPSEKDLEGGGKPAEEKEMIGIDSATSTESTVQPDEESSKEMIGVIPGEFMAIGKDTKSSKITKMKPATAPPNLKEGHEEGADSFEQEMEELEEGDK